MTARSDLWQIDREGAHLKCGALQARALCEDGFGLLVDAWRGSPVAATSVLCTAGPSDGTTELKPAEKYLRASDFIVDYKPHGPHRTTAHVYCRAAFDERAAAARLELIISANTELLDSEQNWLVGSTVASSLLFHAENLQHPKFEQISAGTKATDLNRSVEHLFLFRAGSCGFSFAQMVHPSDFVAAEISFKEDNQTFLYSTFFSEHLEKGVIRRGRICGWFLPAENDLETAVALARQFVDEPLPLTA